MPITPEDRARESIDKLLTAAGWIVQDRTDTNLSAGPGVAVREFPLKKGHGEADYLLFVDQMALGVVEAKKEGATLTQVELQSQKYSEGVPDSILAPRKQLPFRYESTGVETRFTNLLEPDARSRPVFAFHRPETLAEWLTQELQHPGSTLRARLRHMPELATEGLRPAQIKAICSLEKSLADNRPRALIQMASGGGKTYTACNVSYRLIKHAGARRILFLVDRGNLGRQTLKEFQAFRTPEENRLFTELYNVQHMTSNTLDDVSRVCITTIQRLYSMLKGEELDPALEEESTFTASTLLKEPVPVGYNPKLPIETFDFIITDECHRSIYNLWRQVLEYFDAFTIGLTATPSKQTLGFFRQNLVMEYSHEEAVADRVNVDFDVYRIRTPISEHGSTVNAGFFVDRRDRQTRKLRWEKLDEDLSYDPNELDRQVVAPDQIRTIIRAFKERLFTEIFPGRKEVPKTLIFAKDDTHADDIVQIVREEFGKGNDFCQIEVREGDLLLNTRNSVELIGKTGVVKFPPSNCVYNNNLMRIRFIGVHPEFLVGQMLTDQFRTRLGSIKRSTTNVAAVYAKDLFPLEIAIPPYEEQLRIVQETAKETSAVDAMLAEALAATARSERLRQSIKMKKQRKTSKQEGIPENALPGKPSAAPRTDIGADNA